MLLYVCISQFPKLGTEKSQTVHLITEQELNFQAKGNLTVLFVNYFNMDEIVPHINAFQERNRGNATMK